MQKQNIKYNTHLSVKLENDLKEDLKVKADDYGISLSGYVRLILKETINNKFQIEGFD